jgi:hypothetical protein
MYRASPPRATLVVVRQPIGSRGPAPNQGPTVDSNDRIPASRLATELRALGVDFDYYHYWRLIADGALPAEMIRNKLYVARADLSLVARLAHERWPNGRRRNRTTRPGAP